MNGFWNLRQFDLSLERDNRDEKNLVDDIYDDDADIELPYSLIHHFFHTIHTSGVRQMNIILGGQQLDSSPHIVDCSGASILYRFDNGPQVYLVKQKY